MFTKMRSKERRGGTKVQKAKRTNPRPNWQETTELGYKGSPGHKDRTPPRGQTLSAGSSPSPVTHRMGQQALQNAHLHRQLQPFSACLHLSYRRLATSISHPELWIALSRELFSDRNSFLFFWLALPEVLMSPTVTQGRKEMRCWVIYKRGNSLLTWLKLYYSRRTG